MYNEYKYSVEEYMMQGQVSNFLYRVYGWMAAALAVSASVAYYVSTVPSIYMKLFSSNLLFFGLLLFQIGLVVALSFFLMKLNYATAVVLFMVYAATLGLTLSSVFLIYKVSSIYVTFFVTAGMFGIMCLYGYYTKADLSTVRNLGTMALFGLILGFLINLYFKNSTLDYVLSGIGVLIFTALTAADMQKIKEMGYRLLANEQMMRKVAVLGALTLYLDFINLFLLLLRFTGSRRES